MTTSEPTPRKGRGTSLDRLLDVIEKVEQNHSGDHGGNSPCRDCWELVLAAAKAVRQDYRD